MKNHIETFVFHNLRANAYIIWNDYGEGIIIDPGCNEEYELHRLFNHIEINSIKPLSILITHSHFDHICGVESISKRYHIKAWLHKKEQEEFLFANYKSDKLYSIKKTISLDNIRYIDGDSIYFGNFKFKVLRIPGHTSGSVCFYLQDDDVLFVGDTMIKGSLGFVDYGYEDLLVNIKNKILNLPDKTKIFYGHGESSTIGDEKLTNPFFIRLLS